MPDSPVIFWFRRDLRLTDNPALSCAVETGRPVIPVFILDEETDTGTIPGAASRWWLHRSLEALRDRLREKGAGLVLRRGKAAEVLPGLAADTGADTIFFCRGYDAGLVAQEEALHDALAETDVKPRRFSGSLFFEPEKIGTGAGSPYRVFTPFWKACLERSDEIGPGLEEPARIYAPDGPPRSDDLGDWGLLPENPNWAEGFEEPWRPGEAGAQDRLGDFMDEAMGAYRSDRDRPGIDGTSRLSPHLHFGEIGPRQCWNVVRHTIDRRSGLEPGGDAFLREIGWREFCQHLLFHWPEMTDQPFREEFARFPWADEDEDTERCLRAWQRGKTGYPIVDAGMRQLWQTGWMHNRVRMVAASLLCKHLLVHWRHGAEWFEDTLVDADLANNRAGWQWVAGSGADAAPYFRVFNPVLQGEKFDPRGDYVRRFVPELAELPDKHVHAPWDAPRAVLEKAGVTLGETYPLPIVEHSKGRTRALDAYEVMKETA